MTPQLKALDIIGTFLIRNGVKKVYKKIERHDAKQCSLIAVDEILNFMIKSLKWDKETNGNIEYWQEVKQEIEKL